MKDSCWSQGGFSVFQGVPRAVSWAGPSWSLFLCHNKDCMALPENRLAAVSRQWVSLPNELHSLIRSFVREPTPTAAIIKDFFKLTKQHCHTDCKGGLFRHWACLMTLLLDSGAPAMSLRLGCLVSMPEVYHEEGRYWPNMKVHCHESFEYEETSLYTEYNG